MRWALLFALVVSASAGAADWSQWSTWQSSDPEVRASSAFSAKAGRATARGAAFADAGSGGVTLSAVRNFNGVWEASKSHPITKAQVATMARGVARGLGWAGLAATGAQAIIDALEAGGVTWDADQNDWTVPYPGGEFYYADYENDFDFTPSNYLYQLGWSGAGYNMEWLPIIPLSLPCEIDAAALGSPWVCAGDMAVMEWFTGGQHWRRVKWHLKKTTDGSYSGWRYSPYLNRTGAGCPSGQVAAPGGGCSDPPVPTTNPPVPATDAEMDQAISDGIDQYPGSAPAVAQQSAENGGSIPVSTNPPWTGPSSVPGGTSSSTTTGPGGTTTQQTATTHHFSYGDPHPDAVTVTDEETVTTTAPDGQQTTTTTTTTGEQVTGGDAGGTGEGGPTIFDLCVMHPDASGCIPVGLVEDLAVETQDVDVDFSVAETSGTCPAPIVLPVMGQTHNLSWEPVCDFAEGTAPIVRAMAALSAGLWVIFMFRRS